MIGPEGGKVLVSHFWLNLQAVGILNNDLHAAVGNVHAFVPYHRVKHRLTQVLKDCTLVNLN